MDAKTDRIRALNDELRHTLFGSHWVRCWLLSQAAKIVATTSARNSKPRFMTGAIMKQPGANPTTTWTGSVPYHRPNAVRLISVGRPLPLVAIRARRVRRIALGAKS